MLLDEQAVQKEFAGIKGEQKVLEQRVAALERVAEREGQQIMALDGERDKIGGSATWVKRTITGAIVTAICTGVIGGAIAIMYNLLQK